MPQVPIPAPARSTELDPVQLARIRALVRLMETAIRVPGTQIRFGADAIIGLVPGLGDLVGGVLSALIITEAIRSGVPRPVVLRMFGNVGVDVIGGAVPVAGDLFDVLWKSGVRNLALLERYHDQPDRTTSGTRRGLVALAVGVGLLAAAGMAVAVVSAWWILRWLTGT